MHPSMLLRVSPTLSVEKCNSGKLTHCPIYQGFQPPVAYMDIARFIFDSQTRFPDSEPQYRPATPELVSEFTPQRQPNSVFDSGGSESQELSESDLPPLPAKVARRYGARATRGTSISSEISSITMPMESTARLPRNHEQRMSGLSTVSSIEESPAVIMKAARRQVLTPKKLNNRPSKRDSLREKAPNVYFSENMDRERQEALDYTSEKLEGRVKSVLSSKGEAKEK